MHLVSTSDKIQIQATVAGDLDCHSSYTDYRPAQPTDDEIVPGRRNLNVTVNTLTDLVLAPAASEFRKVRFINIFNDHASNITEVTISHTDGTTAVKIDRFTIPPGAKWTYGSEPDV